MSIDKINASEEYADKWLKWSAWISLAIFAVGATWFGLELYFALTA